VVTRARQHVADGRKMPANSAEQRRLFEAFIAAAQNGDVASLEGTLRTGAASACAWPRCHKPGRWPVMAAVEDDMPAAVGHCDRTWPIHRAGRLRAATGRGEGARKEVSASGWQ